MENTSRKYRDCLGCFTTGVAIATTIAQNNALVGVTINSFSSVSLEPPLVLFSLERAASSFSAFCAADYFAINILSEKQMELSRLFAGPDAGKWEKVPHRFGTESGAPLIEGTIATLECRKEHVYEGGDHLIFVGRVLHFDSNPAADQLRPLTYYKGTYRSIGDLS